MMKALQKRQNEEIEIQLHQKIGQQLHLQYDSLLKDELPPRMEDLLRCLEARLH